MNTTPPQVHPETSEPTGMNEVSLQQFEAKLKDLPPESILNFDLRTAYPVQITSKGILPKLSDKIWRRVLDEAMAEFGGAYAQVKGGTIVKVWFENLPAGAGAAKLPSLAARMADIDTRAHAKGPDVNLDEFFPVAGKDGPQLSPEMAKLMQHGLTANPSSEILDFWLTRTTQTIMMSPTKTPMVKDIMSVVMKADSSFTPVWAPANELLLGGWVQIRTSVPHASWTAAEPIRQDLLGLFTTCLQLSVLAGKKVQSIGFLSLRASTLLSKTAMDMIVAFLGTLSPDAKKSILVEIKGLPKSMPSPAIKKSMEDIAPHIKAFMMDTGMLSKDDFSKDVPKLHACGFDLTGMSLPEPELAGLMKKYADLYKTRAQKPYVKGVPTPALVKAAKESGFAYITGNAVHAPEKILAGMRPFPIKL